MGDAILIAAIPFFLLLIGIEFWADRRRGTGHYRLNDVFSSLSVGIISRSTKLVAFGLGAYVMQHHLPNLALPIFAEPEYVWLAWPLTFVIYDFVYYWTHRMSHQLNMLWASHSVHHQSEDYNLTTALRQTSSSVLTWIFSVPMLILGMPFEMYLTCAALNLIYQYWVHTQHIGKLGWFEKAMVTPSHHRVHHAQNAVYIDKNHGGVFILWDKWFGTFQEELDDEKPIYGIRRALHSFNPFWANVQVWSSLFLDAWRTKSYWEKIRIWVMPTGWRPADVEVSHPIQKADLTRFKKFDPQVGRSVQIYAMVQLTAAVGMMLYFLWHFENLSYPLVILGWLMASLPLMTTGLVLQGRSKDWEFYRHLLAWIGCGLGFSLMAPSTVLVYSVYMLVSSVAYFCLLSGGDRQLQAT